MAKQATGKPTKKVVASTIGALLGGLVIALLAAVGVDTGTEFAELIAVGLTATVGSFLAGWLKEEGHLGEEPEPADEVPEDY